MRPSRHPASERAERPIRRRAPATHELSHAPDAVLRADRRRADGRRRGRRLPPDRRQRDGQGRRPALAEGAGRRDRPLRRGAQGRAATLRRRGRRHAARAARAHGDARRAPRAPARCCARPGIKRIVLVRRRPHDRRRRHARARSRPPAATSIGPPGARSGGCRSRSTTAPAYTRLVRRVEHRPRGGAARRPGRGAVAARRRRGASCPTAATSRSAAASTAWPRSPRRTSTASPSASRCCPTSRRELGRRPAAGCSRSSCSAASSSWRSPSRWRFRARCSRRSQRFLDAARRLGSRRLLDRGADRGPRRVRRARRRVQQDVAPARGAPGGAQPRARAAAGRDAAHRRDVRLQPRSRRPARARRRRPRVDGVGADGGRAAMRAGAGGRWCEARAPATSSGLTRRRSHAAEAQALDAGEPARGAPRQRQRAGPPAAGRDDGEPRARRDRRVARRGRAVHAGRARAVRTTSPARPAVSIENVDLHETVQRQAVTDELTGLSNHRRFQEVMATEVERARRFGQPLGLVHARHRRLQAVNDTYGHQQGDVVLREVARVLRESSREIDEPARYGGEELAVALPQTDLEGAYCSPSACDGASRRSRCRGWTATGTAARHASLRRRRDARLRGRQATRSSPPPTRRSTGPSARARTAPCGPRALEPA